MPFLSNTGTSRTDRRTTGRTDGQNSYINIARLCADVCKREITNSSAVAKRPRAAFCH